MLLPIAVLAAATSADPVRLIGIIESRQRSVVVLCSGARTRTAAVGERAFGHLVLRAGNGVAALEIDGRVVELRLAEIRWEPPSRSPGPRPEPTPTAEDYPSASVRVFDRKEVDRRLAEEIPRILAETAVVPERQDSRVMGLRLSRIAAGSLLLDAGLAAGDVLTRIDGVDIDGLGALIGLWPRLQSATELEATVLRNGEPFKVRVGFR